MLRCWASDTVDGPQYHGLVEVGLSFKLNVFILSFHLVHPLTAWLD
jgi:hypothetical protein